MSNCEWKVNIVNSLVSTLSESNSEESHRGGVGQQDNVEVG
jgi:hypothetical protein